MVFGLLTQSHGNSAGQNLVTGKEFKGQARLRGSFGQKGPVIDHVINFTAVLAKDHDQALHGAVHRLYAKCLIQEKQDEYHDSSRHKNDNELEAMKDSVISVSKAANVVSKFTSFVAIDKDSRQPVSGPLKKPMFCYEAQDALLYATDSGSDDDDDDSVGFNFYDDADEEMARYENCGSDTVLASMHLKGALPARNKAKGASPQENTKSSSKKTKPKGFFSSLFGSSAPPPPPPAAFSIGMAAGGAPPTAKVNSPCPPPAPGSMIQKKKESPAAMSVISLQKASGSWDLTDELVSLCGTSRDALIKGCPKEIAVDTSEGKLLWATALALVLLMGKFTDQKDEWEMIAEKGTKWMKKNLPAGVKYENVLEAAATTVGVKIY